MCMVLDSTQIITPTLAKQQLFIDCAFILRHLLSKVSVFYKFLPGHLMPFNGFKRLAAHQEVR